MQRLPQVFLVPALAFAPLLRVHSITAAVLRDAAHDAFANCCAHSANIVPSQLTVRPQVQTISRCRRPFFYAFWSARIRIPWDGNGIIVRRRKRRRRDFGWPREWRFARNHPVEGGREGKLCRYEGRTVLLGRGIVGDIAARREF